MDNAKAKGRTVARDRFLPIKVFVNLDERAVISKGAQTAGMSASAYLRSLGVGYRPRIVSDVKTVDRLAEVNDLVGKVTRLPAGRVDPDTIRMLKAAQSILAEMVRDDR